MSTKRAAHLAAETEDSMGRMKDLAIELEAEFHEWVSQGEPGAMDLDAYMAWASERISDGAAPGEVTPDDYADELVARAEQAAEDAEWRAGCGPRRSAL